MSEQKRSSETFFTLKRSIEFAALAAIIGLLLLTVAPGWAIAVGVLGLAKLVIFDWLIDEELNN
jgi:hypothetical protein